jgi:hypothetical protein
MVNGPLNSFLAEMLHSTESSPSKIVIISDNARGLRSPTTPSKKTSRRPSSHMPSYLPPCDTTNTVAISKLESDYLILVDESVSSSSQKVTLNTPGGSRRRHSTDGKLSRWENSDRCDSDKLQCDNLFAPVHESS